MSHKAIVISPFWATIISSLLVAFILGGAGTAKGIYDAQADATKERAVIQEQIKPLQSANIPTRMATMEVQMLNQTNAMSDMKRQLNKQDDKLDRLLERQGHK